MPIPSMAEMRAAGLKPEADPMWLSRGYRHLSLHVSRLAVGAGLTAVGVTTISGVFAVAGSLVLAFLSPAAIVASVVMMQMLILLDHVDGEVARLERYRRPGHQFGIAGAYYDQLIHFFHGSAFYGSLGLGLSWSSGNIIWGLLGVGAAVGTSAFPWLVAHYAVMSWAARTSDTSRIPSVASDINRHALLETGVREETYLLPRSWREAKWLFRQAFGFPTSMFIFSVVGLADAMLFASRGYPLLKVYLAGMALMKVFVALTSTRSYLSRLRQIS